MVVGSKMTDNQRKFLISLKTILIPCSVPSKLLIGPSILNFKFKSSSILFNVHIFFIYLKITWKTPTKLILFFYSNTVLYKSSSHNILLFIKILSQNHQILSSQLSEIISIIHPKD
jgi:hypothetical protein